MKTSKKTTVAAKAEIKKEAVAPVKSACFTGHRDMPWGLDLKNPKCKEFALNTLLPVIRNYYEHGYKVFRVGGAVGFDMIALITLLKFRKENAITIEVCIPCKNHTAKWQKETKELFDKLLKQVDKVTRTSKFEYYAGCMQRRNEYMVTNSNAVIAYFNGTKGGTANTITYAKEKGKKITVIHIVPSSKKGGDK